MRLIGQMGLMSLIGLMSQMGLIGLISQMGLIGLMSQMGLIRLVRLSACPLSADCWSADSLSANKLIIRA